MNDGDAAVGVTGAAEEVVDVVVVVYGFYGLAWKVRSRRANIWRTVVVEKTGKVVRIATSALATEELAVMIPDLA